MNVFLRLVVLIKDGYFSGNVKDVAMQAFGEGTEVIPAGGAGYKVVSLFEDIASVYVHTTAIKKWDICPG